MENMKIVIIGAGPCGLGAAWRLNELSHSNWMLFEKNDYPGGLAASFKDSENFCWDLGGHVLFSHYDYFDTVMNTVMDQDQDWLYHDRSAWVWMENRFIPYPIQNNIHRLPTDIFRECLHGLLDLLTNTSNRNISHFGEWIDASFGKGLAKWFLKPYNYKVWAYPVKEMSASWVGERVARVDIKRILDNYISNQDDIGWGPNSQFRFPKSGGTGTIWKKIVDTLPEEKIKMNTRLSKIHLQNKFIEFSDGKKEDYDVLISTMPIDELIELSSLKNDYAVSHAKNLKYSSTHVVGIACKGTPPETLRNKCWIYFPENDNPFYRATVFSNYSPNNVPDINDSWSLMFEVSESSMKKVASETIVQDVIQGALNTRLVRDKSQILHTWHKRMEKGYPTPSIGRNNDLFPLLKKLEEFSVYSRGRFGAWRYEVGNMDHSFMQGVESANRVIYHERELTLWYPGVVNSPHPAEKFISIFE